MSMLTRFQAVILQVYSRTWTNILTCLSCPSVQNHGILIATKSIEATVFFFISLEKCCQVQMLADQAAAARGLKPRLIDPENAARTQRRLGSDMGGWFNGIPEFQLLEHEEGMRFEYIPVQENM
jgi:ribulose-5-phosphate 4-epimerase/fuculose-1-phosphate aldolase